jgi:hypothetical protein
MSGVGEGAGTSPPEAVPPGDQEEARERGQGCIELFVFGSTGGGVCREQCCGVVAVSKSGGLEKNQIEPTRA